MPEFTFLGQLFL